MPTAVPEPAISQGCHEGYSRYHCDRAADEAAPHLHRRAPERSPWQELYPVHFGLAQFLPEGRSERGECTNLMSLKDALVRHKAEEFEARDHNSMGFGTIPG